MKLFQGQKLDLGSGPIGPLLFQMSMPSVAAMLMTAVYNLVDVYWLARVGPKEIAALTVSFPFQIVLGAVGVGTGIGAGSFAARMFGSRRHDLANRTAGQGILLSVFFGAAVIACGLLFPSHLLRFFGATEDILEVAQSYLGIFVFAAPFQILLIISSNLFRAEGNPNLSMYVIVFSALVGAVLDPFLILGWGPFPALGIRGAALALLIGQVGTAFVSLAVLLSRRSRYRIRLRDILPDPAIITAVYKVGFPAFVMNITLSMVYTVFNHVLGGFGPRALATLGLLFRVTGMVVWVLFGIGHGVMPLVGYSYGAGLYRRLAEVVRMAVRVSTLIAAGSMIILELFAPFILSLFTDDARLIETAVPAVRIYSTALLPIAPVIIWISMFNGMGKGFTSMVFLVTRDTLLLIPFLFLFPALLGLNGVWLAHPVSNCLTFLVVRYWAEREMNNLATAESCFPAV